MNGEIAIYEEDRERARLAAIAAASALEAGRAEQRVAARNLAQASAALTTWQAGVIQEFGQGTAAANRRLDPAWSEHAARIKAIQDAQAAEAAARAQIESLIAERDAADGVSSVASATLLGAMREQREMASGPNNWERTWGTLGETFGLTGPQFLLYFGAFASILISLASYLYAYSNSAMLAPVVKGENERAARSREKALEAADNRAGGVGAPRPASAKAGLMSSAVAAVAPAAPSPSAEADEIFADPGAGSPSAFRNLMDRALGQEDPALPCGLRQSEYDDLAVTQADGISRLESDARDGMLGGVGERALRESYGGNDRAGKAYKHWLVLNGFARYNGDGSIAIIGDFKKDAA